MRKILTSALILLLGGVIGTATAQNAKKMVAQAEVIEIMLLRQESVRTELKVDAAEAKKIFEFTHKQFETAQEVHKLPEAQQKARWELMAKDNKEFMDKCLSAQQHKRLDQIAMQTAGLLLVTKPSIARELSLTAQQKSQAMKMQEATQEKVREVMHAENKTMRNEKLAELRKASDTQLVNLLTADQRTKWKEMTGAPFKGKLVFEEAEQGK